MSDELRSSYEQLTEMYPERCRRYAICPRIVSHLLKACAEAEVRNLDSEQTLDLNKEHVAQVEASCIDGQLAQFGLANRIRCGMTRRPAGVE